VCFVVEPFFRILNRLDVPVGLIHRRDMWWCDGRTRRHANGFSL